MTFNPSSEPPAFDPTTAVSVGRIVTAHSIHGEVKVQALSDFPKRFDVGARLWLDNAPIRIERSRRQQSSLILKLEGIDSRNAAEALRGKELQVPEATPIYEKDRYYLHDIIGLDVFDAEGSQLGVLEDVMGTGANDVFVVRGERGELLLPAVEDVVQEVDVRGKRIVVNLLPGLDFIAPSRPAPKPRRARRPAQTAGGYEQAQADSPEAGQPSA